MNAVEEALIYGVQDLDSLVTIHNRITGITPPLKPLKMPEGLPELTEFHFDAEGYDRAFLKVVWIYAQGTNSCLLQDIKAQSQSGREL